MYVNVNAVSDVNVRWNDHSIDFQFRRSNMFWGACCDVFAARYLDEIMELANNMQPGARCIDGWMDNVYVNYINQYA